MLTTVPPNLLPPSLSSTSSSQSPLTLLKCERQKKLSENRRRKQRKVDLGNSAIRHLVSGYIKSRSIQYIFRQAAKALMAEKRRKRKGERSHAQPENAKETSRSHLHFIGEINTIAIHQVFELLACTCSKDYTGCKLCMKDIF